MYLIAKDNIESIKASSKQNFEENCRHMKINMDDKLDITTLREIFHTFFIEVYVKEIFAKHPIKTYMADLFSTIRVVYLMDKFDNTYMATYALNNKHIIEVHGMCLYLKFADFMNVLLHEMHHILFNHSVRTSKWLQSDGFRALSENDQKLQMSALRALAEYYADYDVPYVDSKANTPMSYDSLQSMFPFKKRGITREQIEENSMEGLVYTLKHDRQNSGNNKVGENNASDLIDPTESLQDLTPEQLKDLMEQLKDVIKAPDGEPNMGNMRDYIDRLIGNNKNNDNILNEVTKGILERAIASNGRGTGSYSVLDKLAAEFDKDIPKDYVRIFRNRIYRSFGGMSKKVLDPKRLNKKTMGRYSEDEVTFFTFGKRKLPKEYIYVAIDESGSVDNDLLEKYLTVLVSIMKTYNIKFEVIKFTDGINKIEEMDIYNIHEIIDAGREFSGGTSFTPVLKYIAEKKHPNKMVLFFTDGYGESGIPTELIKEIDKIFWCLPYSEWEPLSAPRTPNAEIILCK